MRIRKDRAGLDAILKPTDLEIAWAAGIFEGEGSCCASGTGKRSFVVAVDQKDPELLYRLRDLFGGTVDEYENNRGTLANSFKSFTIFRWAICGDRARIFLAAIYGYLTVRRKTQIDKTSAVRFLEFVGTIPASDVIDFLKARMADYVAVYQTAAKVADRLHRKEFYDRKKQADPTFMERRRQMTAAWRLRGKVPKLSLVG